MALKMTVPAPKQKFHPANCPPPHFKELTEKEFAQSLFFTYDALKTEYRQIMPGALLDENSTDVKPPMCNGRPTMMALKMFWFHGGQGIGMTNDYWNGKVRYFKFAECEHTMQHTKCLGNCYNEYTCSKCGYRQEVDSSD